MVGEEVAFGRLNGRILAAGRTRRLNGRWVQGKSVWADAPSAVGASTPSLFEGEAISLTCTARSETSQGIMMTLELGGDAQFVDANGKLVVHSNAKSARLVILTKKPGNGWRMFYAARGGASFVDCPASVNLPEGVVHLAIMPFAHGGGLVATLPRIESGEFLPGYAGPLPASVEESTLLRPGAPDLSPRIFLRREERGEVRQADAARKLPERQAVKRKFAFRPPSETRVNWAFAAPSGETNPRAYLVTEVALQYPEGTWASAMNITLEPVASSLSSNQPTTSEPTPAAPEAPVISESTPETTDEATKA